MPHTLSFIESARRTIQLERDAINDLLQRIDGDFSRACELLLVLPDTTAQGAARLAEQLCDAARDLPPLPGGTPALTLSVGVFGGRLEPGDSWDQLIHAADQALEQARQYGGNRVHTTATLGRMAHAGMMTSSHATFPTSLH